MGSQYQYRTQKSQTSSHDKRNQPIGFSNVVLDDSTYHATLLRAYLTDGSLKEEGLLPGDQLIIDRLLKPSVGDLVCIETSKHHRV